MDYRQFLAAIVATSALAVSGAPARASDAARALAEKFATGPSKPVAQSAAKPRPDDTAAPRADVKRETQRLSDEREMLERARSEAADADAKAASERRAVEAERTAELKRLAEKLRVARETREAKRVLDKKAADDKAMAEARQSLPTAPVIEPRRAETPATAMQRREFWKPDVAVAPAERVEIESHTRSGLGMRPSDAGSRGNKVTVLLVMAPGAKGIRRLEKTADPIVCSTLGCYVGMGSGVPARLMPHSRATGFINTWGDRAGACRHSLTCVFRDVDLGDGTAGLQPIDLKVLKHDRRQLQTVSADTTCRVTAGRLTCAQPVVASDYVLWVVPEHVAEMAGPEMLAKAVNEGLPSVDQRAGETTSRVWR